jgi:hypothetical protein
VTPEDFSEEQAIRAKQSNAEKSFLNSFINYTLLVLGFVPGKRSRIIARCLDVSKAICYSVKTAVNYVARC